MEMVNWDTSGIDTSVYKTIVANTDISVMEQQRRISPSVSRVHQSGCIHLFIVVGLLVVALKFG